MKRANTMSTITVDHHQGENQIHFFQCRKYQMDSSHHRCQIFTVGKSDKPENKQGHQPRRPANPPARFALRQEKTANQTKNGARAQTSNNHKKDLPKDTADLPLCHSTKACKINYPPRHFVKPENRSKGERLRYQK